MTADRYRSYLIAGQYLDLLPEFAEPEQAVLAEAAESFLLARSATEPGLDDSIDSACWSPARARFVRPRRVRPGYGA
jgi:hypothetical protein